MANMLDEVTGNVNEGGRDVRVIDRQIPVKIGFGSYVFEVALWITIPILVFMVAALIGRDLPSPLLVIFWGSLIGLLPGIVFIFMKIKAHNYFQMLEQKIQSEASNIDNYLEQRVQILQNVVGLVEKAIDVDKDVMKTVAAYRGGVANAENRNAVNQNIDVAFGRLFPQVEAYPKLKSQNAIIDAMQQNNYLQREITAARSVYNSRVTQWNTDIFDWPTKMIVAARNHYTTRIPFTTTDEIREKARSKFW
jgi:LemA protein